jgi:hypothetical protein
MCSFTKITFILYISLAICKIIRGRQPWARDNTRKMFNSNAYQEYLNYETPLVSKQNNKDIYLEKGDQSFPFQISLPTNLPTSFKHKLGEIFYLLEAILDIPWSFNKRSIKSFTVINNFDLNNYPELKLPRKVEESKPTGVIFQSGDPVRVEFTTAKTGYVCGELISFSILIENKSRTDIAFGLVKLEQRVKFSVAPWNSSNSKNIIASVSFPKRISARTLETWPNLTLVIPPVCPSSNVPCKNIQIEYALILSFSFDSLFSISRELIIPITIGTVPIYQRQSYIAQPSAPASIQFQSDYASNCETDAPPSYSDVAGNFTTDANANQVTSSNNKENDEVLESDLNIFKPSYPYYKSN